MRVRVHVCVRVYVCMCVHASSRHVHSPTAAAKALYDTDLPASEICKKAMLIAAEMCVYTNDRCAGGFGLWALTPS